MARPRLNCRREKPPVTNRFSALHRVARSDRQPVPSGLDTPALFATASALSASIDEQPGS